MCVNRERCPYVTRGGGETRRGSQSATTSAGDRLSIQLPPSVSHLSVLSAPSLTSHSHQCITCHTSFQPSIQKSILSSSLPCWHIHLPLVSQTSDLLSLLNTNKAINTTLEYTAAISFIPPNTSRYSLSLILCYFTVVSSSVGCCRWRAGPRGRPQQPGRGRVWGGRGWAAAAQGRRRGRGGGRGGRGAGSASQARRHAPRPRTTGCGGGTGGE